MGLKIVEHSGNPVTHGRHRLENGVRLHYYTAGSGPALLLQHGVGGSSALTVDRHVVLSDE
jgi:pimeloyl-ACP methyl ester carboxylesterase